METALFGENALAVGAAVLGVLVAFAALWLSRAFRGSLRERNAIVEARIVAIDFDPAHAGAAGFYDEQTIARHPGMRSRTRTRIDCAIVTYEFRAPDLRMVRGTGIVSFFTAAAARRYVDRHPPRTAVTVWFDPTKPSDNLLVWPRF